MPLPTTAAVTIEPFEPRRRTAGANAPMLRVNRALGFQPVVTYQGWYLPFELTGRDAGPLH